MDGNNINNWVCSDPDTQQWVKLFHENKDAPENNHYKLIEMSLINPETKMYEVYADSLCIEDYLAEMRGELSFILSGFGYGEDEEDCAIIIERMIEQYGEDDVFQVCAECIFEHYGSFQAERLFVGTEKKCEAFIKEYIRKN